MSSATPSRPVMADTMLVADAARICGRSRSWAYDMVHAKTFEKVAGEGPTRVTVESVVAHLDRLREARLAAARAEPSKRRAHLRLVIDNT